MVATDQTIALARDYYDSDEADDFYRTIWGGEDIHVGLYDEGPDISAASRRTVERMAAKAGPLKGKHVLDLGSGYGGAARVLAGEYGAKVTCLNLSAVENERNRAMTAEAGLADKITVVDGSFDSVPFEDETFDLAWSQDAILHAPDRRAVLDEVARVLKPGGGLHLHRPDAGRRASRTRMRSSRSTTASTCPILRRSVSIVRSFPSAASRRSRSRN